MNQNQIKVGDTVEVISSDGSSAYAPFIGKQLKVEKIRSTHNDYEYQIICCEGMNGSGQYPHRFKLVTTNKFDVVDLKPGMRVVTKRGQEAIVVQDSTGKLAIAYFKIVVNNFGSKSYVEQGWDQAYFNRSKDCDISKVYDVPNVWDALKFDEKGALLYNADAAVEEKKAKVEAACAKIAEARKALAAAEQELESI